MKNATEILLGSVDYFTILLTGISGIFVNDLPHYEREHSARSLDYFAIFGERISGTFVNNPPPKNLAFFTGPSCSFSSI